jgi:hypothetical protein
MLNTKLKFVQKLSQRNVRPMTIQESPMDQNKRNLRLEQSALILQKIIRGRVTQNKFTVGTAHRLSLINELRVREKVFAAKGEMAQARAKEAANFKSQKAAGKNAAQEDLNTEEPTEQVVVDIAQQFKNIQYLTDSDSELDDRDFEMQMRYLEELDTKKDLRASSRGTPRSPLSILSPISKPSTSMSSSKPLPVISNITTEYVGKTISFLTKELTRLRQERSITALVKLAERTRRIREFKELERRKVEHRGRDIQDNVWAQVMGVHAETVDSYLESLVNQGLDNVSGKQARANVGEMVGQMEGVIEALVDLDDKQTSLLSLGGGVSASSIVENAGVANAQTVSATSMAFGINESITSSASASHGALSATLVNDISDQGPIKVTDKEIVDDMVNVFALPYVKKEIDRNQDLFMDTKYSKTAHQFTMSTLRDSIEPSLAKHYSAEKFTKEARLKSNKTDQEELEKYEKEMRAARLKSKNEESGAHSSGNASEKSMDALDQDDGKTTERLMDLGDGV